MERSTRDTWAERVRRLKQSGLSTADFAKREGLHPSTLRWWASRLRRDERVRASFVELRIEPKQAAPGRIEVVVREDLRVRVEGEFDAAVLRRLLDVLARA